MGLARVALVVVEAHQPRVGDRHVVALEVVLDHDLPVGGLAAAAALGAEHLELWDPVALEALGEPPRELGQRLRLGVEVDEHEAGQGLDPRGHQAQLRLVELGVVAMLGHAHQPPVGGVVGPAVVAAADRALALAVAGQQLGASVAADVAVGAKLAVLGADDQHGLIAGAGGDVGVGLGQLADVARVLPAAGEDRVHLAAQRLGAQVVAGLERAPDGRGAGAVLALIGGRGRGRLARGRLAHVCLLRSASGEAVYGNLTL